MAAVSTLIAKAKREGSIQSSELTAELEKLDLPVEKIEHIYDTFDAMGIQIVSPELELDVADDLGMDMDEVPQLTGRASGRVMQKPRDAALIRQAERFTRGSHRAQRVLRRDAARERVKLRI